MSEIKEVLSKVNEVLVNLLIIKKAEKENKQNFYNNYKDEDALDFKNILSAIKTAEKQGDEEDKKIIQVLKEKVAKLQTVYSFDALAHTNDLNRIEGEVSTIEHALKL